MGNAILLIKASETQTRHCVAVRSCVIRQTIIFSSHCKRPAGIWQCALVPRSFKNEQKRQILRERKTLIAWLTCFFPLCNFLHFRLLKRQLKTTKRKKPCDVNWDTRRGDNSDFGECGLSFWDSLELDRHSAVGQKCFLDIFFSSLGDTRQRLFTEPGRLMPQFHSNVHFSVSAWMCF